MKIRTRTRKELWSDISDKYGKYAVNDFIKKSFELALINKDYFFDVLTGVLEMKYDEQVRNFDRQ